MADTDRAEAGTSSNAHRAVIAFVARAAVRRRPEQLYLEVADELR